MFNAFKDLFNMNYSQPAPANELDDSTNNGRMVPNQRYSIHRGIERGRNSGPQADADSPSVTKFGSGVKGRVSIL